MLAHQRKKIKSNKLTIARNGFCIGASSRLSIIEASAAGIHRPLVIIAYEPPSAALIPQYKSKRLPASAMARLMTNDEIEGALSGKKALKTELLKVDLTIDAELLNIKCPQALLSRSTGLQTNAY